VDNFEPAMAGSSYEQTDTCRAYETRVNYIKSDGEVIHSAIIVSVDPNNSENNFVISKWGPGGLYQHKISNGPYNKKSYGNDNGPNSNFEYVTLKYYNRKSNAN